MGINVNTELKCDYPKCTQTITFQIGIDDWVQLGNQPILKAAFAFCPRHAKRGMAVAKILVAEHEQRVNEVARVKTAERTEQENPPAPVRGRRRGKGELCSSQENEGSAK